MLTVLLVVGIGLIILGIVFGCKDDWDSGGCIVCVCIGIIVSFICALIMIFVINDVITYSQMDERIEIYQEENIHIEEQVKTTVEAYQEYEKEIFENIDLDKISGEKLILLTSVYPELKSDALVQELISVYTENNNQIKELKTKKLDYKVSCWWLYFG